MFHWDGRHQKHHILPMINAWKSINRSLMKSILYLCLISLLGWLLDLMTHFILPILLSPNCIGPFVYDLFIEHAMNLIPYTYDLLTTTWYEEMFYISEFEKKSLDIILRANNTWNEIQYTEEDQEKDKVKKQHLKIQM